MYREIYFNSQRAANTSCPRFTLGDQIYVHKFKILAATIPYTFYSVNASNNQVKFVEASSSPTVKTATLSPAGNYTSASIETELASAMTAAGSQTYSCNYDDSTGKITVSAAGTFKVLSGNNGSSAWDVLGLSKTADTASATSVTFQNYADLASNTSILIVSSSLTSQNIRYISDMSQNVLCNIPVSVRAGEILYWENVSGGWINADQSLTHLDLMLLDSSTGLPIDLNGGNFTVVLGILETADDIP